MFAVDGDMKIFLQLVVYGIGSARNRLDQAASSAHRIEGIDVKADFLQPVQDDFLAEVQLIHDMLIFFDDGDRMIKGGLIYYGLILKQGDLGGSASGINCENMVCHALPPLVLECSLSTAARAMELILTSLESERLVRITGARVPVRIFPFRTFGTI